MARHAGNYRSGMVAQRDRRPGPQTLADLRAVVDEARKGLATARRLDGGERGQMVDSQRRLLSALENFIRALDVAGHAPQHLRAEVDLLRGLTAASNRPYQRNA